MIIFPAIDLKNGKCVRLLQGDYDKVTVYDEDPIKVCKSFITKGATHIHIVDLDGAREGVSKNAAIIKEIANTLPIFVQTGGGIRSFDDAKTKIEMGVSRVIFGTVAVTNPEIVEKTYKAYHNKVAVSIDARDGYAAISGWEKTTSIKAVDLAKQMQKVGINTFVYTDISKDGMMSGPNIDALSVMVAETNADIIASGGISCYEDFDACDKIGCYGVISGKAIYENKIDVEKLVKMY